MAKPKTASKMDIVACEECGCVHLALKNAAGGVMGEINLSPDDAIDIAELLANFAEGELELVEEEVEDSIGVCAGSA